MRESFNTLGALVTQELKQDLLASDLFLFVSRDGKGAKVLYFDGTGLCLFAERMEKVTCTTDFIVDVDGVEAFSIPGGTPSRCIPLVAPAECHATDVEMPASGR